MKIWIDPASGWQFGFPDIWDDEKETLEEFLNSHNYPKDMRHLPFRYWEAKEDECNE